MNRLRDRMFDYYLRTVDCWAACVRQWDIKHCCVSTIQYYENSSATLLKYVVLLAAFSYSPAVLDNISTLSDERPSGNPST